MQTLIIFLFMMPLRAELNLPNLKRDIETHEASLKFQKNMSSSEKIKDATWLPTEDSIHSFRYLHAVLAAAMNAERLDQKTKARAWLENYECENVLACREFEIALEVASRNHKKREAWIDKIKAPLMARIALLKVQTPTIAGLCIDNSERTKWLELAYQIYCPSFPTLAEQTRCAGFSEGDIDCSTTRALFKSIEFQSSQLMLSSSAIMNYKHLGAKDCELPWSVEMLCDLGGKQAVYKVKCSKLNKKFPTEIKCKE